MSCFFSMEFNDLRQSCETITTLEQCEQRYQQFLGKEWSLTLQFKKLWSLPPDQKKEIWQRLSDQKKLIEQLYHEKKSLLAQQHITKQLEQEIIDSSLPGIQPEQWYFTLLTKARRNIEEIFHSMWFSVEYGKDVVTKYENFYSVNIPATHPATEMHDTFFLHQHDQTGDNLILRTQTSAMQNTILKNHPLPIKAIIPWKVYRYENMDASHDTVFWQVEGIVVDKNISIAHLKGTMMEILQALFGKKTEIRMRPAYFPFTEPGLEIDAQCPICNGKGCSLCKHTGRIEILWAGMIHPNVLKEWNIDSTIYSWFAFWLGLNRMVAIMNTIKDIRYFTNGDLRFLRSFS